tara:strand:- start:171 stop:302 length:132 start_codon:yes stop_codon:yes gene_type:complete
MALSESEEGDQPALARLLQSSEREARTEATTLRVSGWLMLEAL